MGYIDKKYNSNSYYLDVFKQLEETNKCEFNLSAAIWGPFWALYRKMYLLASSVFISFFINGNLVLSLIRLYRRFTQETDDYNILMPHIQRVVHTFLWALGIWIVYQLMSTFLYGKYGNQLYYNYIKKKISQGYHLVKDISSTMSLWSIILILTGAAIALPFIVPITIMLLLLSGVRFIEAFLVDNQIATGFYLSVVFCIIFAIGEFLYYQADAMTVKKFKRNHECSDTGVSEKNLQRYLVAKSKNTYLKIVDWMIFSGIILCIGSALYLEFYYQSPSNRRLQEYYDRNF